MNRIGALKAVGLAVGMLVLAGQPLVAQQTQAASMIEWASSWK